MGRYPNHSRASVIECPVHKFSVALGADGRISTTCPGCILEARVARRRLEKIGRRRLAVA